MGMEIVKKLSVGKLIGKVTAILPDSKSDTTAVELGRVVGIARGTKEGESTFGPWKALAGDFVFEPSVGPNKGSRYRSGVLFVPDVVLDLVAPAAENLGKGEGVEMAFAINAKNDPSVAVLLSYGCSFLIEPTENDPMTALLTKALPAPKADAKKG
jgi:hypothetical protein